jgi:L-ribulose-5-phosphate 3-epimerase
MSKIPIGAITDEFSADLDVALRAMADVGMTFAELRVIGGSNLIDLTDDQVAAARETVERHGMTVLSIASPLLKCVLPDGPALDQRVQQDVFGSAYTFDDQPRLTRRALDIASRTGARMIRVFSYWRTVAPERCFDAIVVALRGLADEAADRGVLIGLENEHGCNIGTGAEAARVLAAAVLGEVPFPDGYSKLPSGRIAHVHAKDCVVEGGRPTWGPLGAMGIDWKGQIAALVADGYTGAISLETHWRGTDGDRLSASTVCGRTLRELVTA